MAHRYLLWWLITAFIWLFLTIYIGKKGQFIIGLVRYFRFFAFASIFVLGFLWIRNQKQLNLLFNLQIIALTIISVIGTLQALKFLPNFWPSYYSIYWGGEGGFLITSTLAPNHTHYSLMMAIGIIMIFTRITISGISNWLLIAATIPMLYSMIASQGRSGWLLLGIYLICNLLLIRKFTWIPVVIIFAGSITFLFSSNTEAGGTSIQKILLYRTITSHEDTKRSVYDVFEESDRSLISRVDEDRWTIYSEVISYWSRFPVFFIAGAGFQNAVKGIGGAALAAHNAYLNIIAEQGILGFFIYVSFLFYLFRLGWRIAQKSPSPKARLFAKNWICLYMGLLAANFFGELIYPGRALFTFLGSVFFITVLYLHPAWSDKDQFYSSLRSQAEAVPKPLTNA